MPSNKSPITLALQTALKDIRTDAQRSGRGQSPALRMPAALLASGCLLGSTMALADGGDTEATATCIGSLPYSDSGTTVGKVDDYDLPADTTAPTLTASCASIVGGAGPAGSLPNGAIYTGTGTAPDAVYRIDFPAGNPDTLTINMDPTGAQDLALIVFCDTVSSSPADGLVVDDTGVGGVAEQVTVGNIAAGTSLYIVVDGYSTGGTPPGPSGPYTLNVTSSGATQPDPSCGAAPSADVSITKTDGVADVTPGGDTTYTITASNAGPSDTAATVTDTFPADLSCTWTCVGAGGGTCTAAGAGNINDAINLPVGSSVTYTAACDIASSATGILSNTATVVGAETDPTPGNDSATDTDTLTASADLSITKSDGGTVASAGGDTIYTITATNAGPSDVSGVSVTDTFPAACTTVSYTAIGAGGAAGFTAAGNGDINDATIDMPAGSSVTYTATCTVDTGAANGDIITNTANVAAPMGVDSNPGNDAATENTAVVGAAIPTIGAWSGALLLMLLGAMGLGAARRRNQA